jgi:hypothetical protein
VRDCDPQESEDPDDAEGGPGRRIRVRGRALYISDEEEFDDLTMEDLFLPVTSLWQVLGAIDRDERLTALGWWGLSRGHAPRLGPSRSTPG